MTINSDFWNSKSVFVTGHTGFKGSWLSIWLAKMGANVHGYALSPEQPKSLFNQANVKSYLSSHTIGDVVDKLKLARCIETSGPDVIFHLAAQPLVLESYTNPVRTFEINVQGTVNLLDISRNLLKQCAIVVITSDKCYENNEWEWPYREVDRLGGSDPYSNSKACAELVVSSFRKSYFSRPEKSALLHGLATARAGNVIGGCDWARHRLIPDFFRALEDETSLQVRNPDATRPWQNILECLGGYLLLAEKLYDAPEQYSDAWNFGPLPQQNLTVQQLIDTLNQLCELKAEISYQPLIHGSEHQQLALDISKANHKLGWRPIWKIEDTLEALVACYLAGDDQVRLHSLIDQQINFHAKLGAT